MRPEIESILRETEKAIVGKRDVLYKTLLTLLADGHILMDDMPGVGKTTLALAFGRAMALSGRRVQFTPDVLPSDLTGFSMYDKATGGFVYRPGALNRANLLLGDEINRASSKTQSALLEAMEERQVTVDGETYPLPQPFLVIATQNSVSAAGTQPLPFAQMDRFLTRLSLGYPDHEAQIALLRDRQTENPLSRVQPAVTKEGFLAMQEAVRQTTVKDVLLDYVSRLAVASREHPLLEVGISPRGALFLTRMARANAWAEGRDYATGGDVQAVFLDVCAHRVLLKEQAAETGKTARDVLHELLKTVESPDRRLRAPGFLKS